MINQLHKLFHNPNNGWDPVPLEYTKKYVSKINNDVIDEVFNYLSRCIKKYEGLKVLDLGGGPGDFTLEFAKRGANVTWYDISNNYKNMVINRLNNNSASIDLYTGYLDDASINLNTQYDLVFNRVCWYYSVSDYTFGDVLSELVSPSGYLYVETNISSCRATGIKSDILHYLNNKLKFKVGHPYPPRGRIVKILMDREFQPIDIDYSRECFDRVLLQKILKS